MTILIIIGMSLATMIPRIMPTYIVDKLEFRPWINRWLSAIPYAALGALIFPGIMTVKEGVPIVGLLGGFVAVILAIFRINIVLVVLGAIVFVYFYPS